jgi:hypothetical protein
MPFRKGHKMDIEEQRREAEQRLLAAVSRRNTQLRKRHGLLWMGSLLLLLLLLAIALGSYFLFVLPVPLQADRHTLYSTDWSSDFNAWKGAGWQKRLNGGVHSDHGGLFLSPYTADGADIQIDVQMKHLGVDAFQGGIVSFGVVLRTGENSDYKVALGDIDPTAPWYPDVYQSLRDFAVVSVRVQKGILTLLINGKQVAQKRIDFPFVGSVGLFAGGDSIVEARSFRVDMVVS